jgi:hypothetical protein
MDLGVDFNPSLRAYLQGRTRGKKQVVFINPRGISRLVGNLVSVSMACTISHAGPHPDQDREVL